MQVIYAHSSIMFVRKNSNCSSPLPISCFPEALIDSLGIYFNTSKGPETTTYTTTLWVLGFRYYLLTLAMDVLGKGLRQCQEHQTVKTRTPQVEELAAYGEVSWARCGQTYQVLQLLWSCRELTLQGLRLSCPPGECTSLFTSFPCLILLPCLPFPGSSSSINQRYTNLCFRLCFQGTWSKTIIILEIPFTFLLIWLCHFLKLCFPPSWLKASFCNFLRKLHVR